MSFIFSKLFWPLVNTFSNVSTHTPIRYFDLSLLPKQLSYFRIIWTLPIWNSSQSFKLQVSSTSLKGRSSTLLVYSPPLWRAKKTKKYLRTSRLQSSNSATRGVWTISNGKDSCLLKRLGLRRLYCNFNVNSTSGG